MRSFSDIYDDLLLALANNADFEKVITPLYEEYGEALKQKNSEYAVGIDCPEHLTHKVKLYTHGHKDEGVWECMAEGTGISGNCEHFDTERISNENFNDQISYLDVCVLCGVEVNTVP